MKVIHYISNIAILFMLMTGCASVDKNRGDTEIAIILQDKTPALHSAQTEDEMEQNVKDHDSESMHTAEMIKRGIADHIESPVHVTSYYVRDGAHLDIALERLIKRNTEIIVTPDNSNVNNQILQRLAGKRTSILTLSNDLDLVESKHTEDVYLFKDTDAAQISFLFKFLTENQHGANIILLVPRPSKQAKANDHAAHGHGIKDFVSAFIDSQRKTLGSLSVNIIATYEYDYNETSILSAISHVAGVVNSIAEDPQQPKKPLIYVHDTKENLQKLIEYMGASSIGDHAVLCGGTSLDFPNNLNTIFLSSAQVHEGQSSYLGVRNYDDAIAYDLGTVIARAIGAEYSSQEFKRYLNNDNIRHQGVSGTMQITTNLVKRKYDVMRQNKGQITKINH